MQRHAQRELVRRGQRLRLLHRHAHQGRARDRRDRAAHLRAGRLAGDPYFTPRERAALAFTETVTRLSETHVPEQAYQEVAAEFSPQQVAALVSLIVTINAWNAIGVSTRAWAPGSYNP